MISLFTRRILAVATALAILASPAAAGPLDGPDFDAAVQRYIEAHPEVILNAINGYVAKQQASKDEALDNAFLSMTDAFLNSGNKTIIGNPSGKVEMVYVLDGACTYCRRMTPIIADLVAKNPDLKIVQYWVPFLTPASEYAGRVAALIAERYPDKYPEFYHQLMLKTAGLTNDVVDDAIVAALGRDVLDIVHHDVTTGSTSEEYQASVQTNLSLAQRASIDGTPFMWIAGTGREGLFRGAVPETNLQQAIEKARAG